MTALSDESIDSGTLETGPDDRHQPGHRRQAAVDVGGVLVDVEVQVRRAAGDLAGGHPAHVGRRELRVRAAGHALEDGDHDVLDPAGRELARVADGRLDRQQALAAVGQRDADRGARPPAVSPMRTPSRLTTRLVWMFSPMTMNGARASERCNGRSSCACSVPAGAVRRRAARTGSRRRTARRSRPRSRARRARSGRPAPPARRAGCADSSSADGAVQGGVADALPRGRAGTGASRPISIALTTLTALAKPPAR